MRIAHHLCAAFILAFLVVSADTERGQFNHETNNGTITITRYTGPGGNVTIPSTINGLLVTCIGGGAFSYCSPTTTPNFGIQTNQFGFRISWATNVPVVVEAPVLQPVQTATTSTNHIR